MSSYWSKQRRIARAVEKDLKSIGLGSFPAECEEEGVLHEITEVQFFDKNSEEEPLSGHNAHSGPSSDGVIEQAHSGQSSGGERGDEQATEHAHDTDDSDDYGEVCSSGEDTQTQLAQWAVGRQISHAAVPSGHSEDFYKLVLQHLHRLEEEVKEVKQQVAASTALLQKLVGGRVAADLCLLEDTDLPLRDVQQLEDLERQLASDSDLKNELVNILAVLGGKTTKDAVRRMLGRVMMKSLALKINWTGTGRKVAFKSLQLKNVLHRAVRRIINTATEEELQKEVALYLKGAADREGGRKERQKNGGNGHGEFVN